MTHIACGQSLWQRLGKSGRPPVPHGSKPDVSTTPLGSWAAALYAFEEQTLVIAINERTYLTLVFRFVPAVAFRRMFCGALAQLLEDLKLPNDIVQLEVAAANVAPLVRLTDISLRRAISDVKFYCGIELMYHQELRTVQWNLNEVPHPGRDPCVPIMAARQVLRAST
jgi:hypothetical protein